jgi:tetrahydromethanopterin S-methyltransferase subunit F
MPMAQLLSNTNAILHIDERLLKELISDTNADGTVSSSTILTEVLLRGGEEVASAATRSQAYTVTELETLATDGNALLRGLVADLALCYLFERRGGEVPESVKAKANRAQQMLNDLRDGRRVFAVDANREAGTASVSVISQATRGSLRLVSDSPFYPDRRSQAY